MENHTFNTVLTFLLNVHDVIGISAQYLSSDYEDYENLLII